MGDDRKVWEYDENPRDNFASFDNRDLLDGKQKQVKWLSRLLAIRKRFIVLFLGLLGCSCLLGYLWPDKYPYFTVSFMQTAAKKYLPVSGGTHHAAQTGAVVQEDNSIRKPGHYEYSRTDIERAKREVLLKRRVESSKQKAIEKTASDKPSTARQEEVAPARYSYEIELYSGGQIHTDNAIMSEETVSFVDSGGLWVSIDRNQVRKITRTRIAAGNP